MAPFRPQTSNPASSSWAVPTSRGNHDEADERTERARLALVRARWERPHEERKHEHSSGSADKITDYRAINTVVAGGTNTCGPLAERDTSTFVMNGSTCRAAPRLKWDSGGSLGTKKDGRKLLAVGVMQKVPELAVHERMSQGKGGERFQRVPRWSIEEMKEKPNIAVGVDTEEMRKWRGSSQSEVDLLGVS